MSLDTLQQDFRAWLQYGDEPAAQGLSLSDARGLLVYQNNYRAQLIDCLEESYPQLLAYLGEAAFRAAAACHIDAHPPHSWTLDDYPSGFADGLRAQFPDDLDVAELAELELRLADCFIAADCPALELAAIDWDVAVLHLSPSVSFLVQTTNAVQLWTALSAEQEPPSAVLLAEPLTIMVWRQDYVSCFRPIDADEYRLLKALEAGLPFATLCTNLVAQHGEAEGIARAGSLLGDWARDQLLFAIAEDARASGIGCAQAPRGLIPSTPHHTEETPR